MMAKTQMKSATTLWLRQPRQLLQKPRMEVGMGGGGGDGADLPVPDGLPLPPLEEIPVLEEVRRLPLPPDLPPCSSASF